MQKHFSPNIILCLLLPRHFTGAVLFISTLSILISLFQTRRQLQQLHDLVALSCTVNILRDGKGEGGGVGREWEEGKVIVRSLLSREDLIFFSPLFFTRGVWGVK